MDGSLDVRSEPVKLKGKVKDALDETRMLVLGAQVLVGFQYNAFFNPGFSRLSELSRWLNLASLATMLLVVALVMTPAPFHRIAEQGRDTRLVQRYATRLIACALAPFAIAIGLNICTVSEHLLGTIDAALLGSAATAIALALWYAVGMALRERDRKEYDMQEEKTSI